MASEYKIKKYWNSVKPYLNFATFILVFILFVTLVCIYDYIKYSPQIWGLEIDVTSPSDWIKLHHLILSKLDKWHFPNGLLNSSYYLKVNAGGTGGFMPTKAIYKIYTPVNGEPILIDIEVDIMAKIIYIKPEEFKDWFFRCTLDPRENSTPVSIALAGAPYTSQELKDLKPVSPSILLRIAEKRGGENFRRDYCRLGCNVYVTTDYIQYVNYNNNKWEYKKDHQHYYAYQEAFTITYPKIIKDIHKIILYLFPNSRIIETQQKDKYNVEIKFVIQAKQQIWKLKHKILKTGRSELTFYQIIDK